jgi:predicted TPR repeat methyltransferase
MDTLAAAPDPDHLARRVREMIDNGQLNAARAVLAAVRRLSPPGPATAELAARLAIAAGQSDVAAAELDAAVAADPGHAGLRRLRADVRHRRGEHVPAAIDAAEAVVLDPHDASGKAILGVLMTELGRPADAVACLAEAVAAEPANPAFVEALAAAQAAGGATDLAAETLAAGIARCPGRVDLRNAAVLLAIRRRDFAAAEALAEAARRAGIADACLFGLLGHALSCLGRHADAADAYDAALKLGPHDPYVRHLVAAAGTLPGGDRAPSPYVRAVFEGYANRFEPHLVALGYRVPGLFRAALLRLAPWDAAGEGAGPTLDLGCGTGLVGLALHDLPIRPLHGVDLAPRMLAQAAAKGIYASLREADILAVLAEPGPDYGLILAADVLCYFGALDPVLQAAFARMRPGGLMLVSTESPAPDEPDPPPWRLGPQGRFVHTAAYLRTEAEAAGFAVRCLAAETQRFENDAPVPGLLGILARP